MTHRALPAELAGILAGLIPPGGAFGHRQHVQLAFGAVHRYGPAQAAGLMSDWIQQIAAYQGTPQKYHATVTRAWCEIVAHHVAADPSVTDFDAFADRNPALLDKRLLARHYRSATLACAAAKTGWVPPDLMPFPWPA